VKIVVGVAGPPSGSPKGQIDWPAFHRHGQDCTSKDYGDAYTHITHVRGSRLKVKPMTSHPCMCLFLAKDINNNNVMVLIMKTIIIIVIIIIIEISDSFKVVFVVYRYFVKRFPLVTMERDIILL